jgi:protein-S-isoprenylcysteine O-methyltransferase Ste14
LPGNGQTSCNEQDRRQTRLSLFLGVSQLAYDLGDKMSVRTKLIERLSGVATGSRKIRNFFTPVGALFYLSIICFFVLIALWVDRILGFHAIYPGLLGILFCLSVFLVALVLIGWSVFNFIRAKGTPVPVNPPPELVVTGPYAYVRNPMLAGVFGVLFGFGLLLGSISLLFVFTPLFIVLNVWELKAIEEPELCKRLGEDYLEYRNHTPMFVPDIGKIIRTRSQ